MFDPENPSWRNPRVLAVLMMVFLSGAVSGALIMRVGLHERMHRGSAPWKSDAAVLSYERLTKELNLTSEQSRQLKGILDDYAKYHEDLQAQLDDWRATGKNQIIRILDATQRQKFEKICNEVQSR